jgi:hypothetical protein
MSHVTMGAFILADLNVCTVARFQAHVHVHVHVHVPATEHEHQHEQHEREREHRQGQEQKTYPKSRLRRSTISLRVL